MSRPLHPTPPIARVLTLLALGVALGAGCSLEEEPDLGSIRTGRSREASAPPIDPNAPFDVRLARIRPEDHVGQQRLCDVVFVGSIEPVSRRAGRRYPSPFAVRRAIRCGAATGEAWADLVFPPEAVSFASSVSPGTRLRVEVVAPDGGFEGATVLAFLAVLEGAQGVTEPRPPVVTVQAQYDFSRVGRYGGLVGQRRRCAVSYVGAIQRVASTDAERFPRGATHHLPIACHHAVGDAWIELVFTPRTVDDALAIERGRVLAVEIRADQGGPADVPFAVLVRPPKP